MSEYNISQDVQNVVQAVLSGVSTTEENGVLLKALQTQMSAAVVNQLSSISAQMNSLSESLPRLIQRYNEKLNEDLETDVIGRAEIEAIIDRIQNKQFQLVETYRRVVQSPNMLFANSTVSEEEKMVMKLFQSFKSADEKKKFLELVKKELDSNE